LPELKQLTYDKHPDGSEEELERRSLLLKWEAFLVWEFYVPLLVVWHTARTPARRIEAAQHDGVEADYLLFNKLSSQLVKEIIKYV